MTFNEIEKLVDREVGTRPEAMLDFLMALVSAADETAMHAEHDWQDERLAKAWGAIAYWINDLHDKIDKKKPW